MKTRFLAILTLFLCVNLGLAQVKIGENPDIINPSSLVELESNDKAFVLTRVDDAQMSAIVPLNGALVYNTTSQCIHYFDGVQWVNLCEAATSGYTFSDNGDGTFTLDDGEGNSITWNGAAETVTTLVDNMDGSFTYANELGDQITIFPGTDDQILTGVAFTPATSELTLGIEDGNSTTVDLSELEESADIAANATDIATNTTDIATNATNIATNTSDIATNATDIATNTTDIATNVTDIATNATDIATNATDIATNATDIATNTTDIATNTADIAAHVAADGDLDSANELNSAVAFDGINLTVTDPGGSLSADISALAYDDTAIQAQVATNTADIATNVADIATNAADITTNTADIATNTADIATNTADIATNTADIATNTADIATNTADIATNVTDIATNATDIAAHITADGDTDNTNEIQTLSKAGNTITLSDGGGSVNETVTSISQNTTTGVITHTDEATGTQTANVVSTDANNSISVGSDGGAYFGAYEKIVIWAEEAAALSSNTLEWSFGNGSTGQIGIPLPEAWEAYAVSFNADISGAGDTVTMAVINAGTNANLFTFTASGTANNIVYTQILATPVAIPAGTAVGFRTVTEVGAVSDARVAVFLRRRP